MTDAQLIAYINQYIITNGVNAITAAVLNPILQAIRQRSQDVTGNPEELTTSVTTNLVAAINSLQALINDFEFAGVQVYSGTDNPNDTEPASFNVGDFYKQVDGGGNTIELFQYNGTSWVSYVIDDGNVVPTLLEVLTSDNIANLPIYLQTTDKTTKYSGEGLDYSEEENENTVAIRFDSPIANVTHTVPAKSTNDTFAMISDIRQGHIVLLADSGTVQSDYLKNVTIDAISADGGSYPDYLSFLTSFNHNTTTGEVTGLDAFPNSKILFHYTKTS